MVSSPLEDSPLFSIFFSTCPASMLVQPSFIVVQKFLPELLNSSGLETYHSLCIARSSIQS
ncbi:hypothetical protein ACLOJK_036867 [Asimina triloba]